MATIMQSAGAEIPAILTKRQAADYVCCTPRYLETQIRLGRLKALKPTGKLVRIPVNADGRAGAVVPIELSLPLGRPDGLRTAGPRTLIQAEGQGRLTEVTINGNRAEVRVVQDSLPGATGVTIVGDSALVLVSRVKAVVVPYRRRPEVLEKKGVD